MKKPDVQPENVLLGNSPPVDDSQASELLFVDPGQPRPSHFFDGVVTGVVIAIACWLGVNFWLRPSGKDWTSLDVLRSAIEKCAEMTNYRSYFETLTNYRQERKSDRPRNFAVMVNGRVESGFDMRKARVEVFEEGRRIEVTLPHGRIGRSLVNLVKDSRGGVRVYDQQGELTTRTFSAKEQSEIISVSMRTVRQRASGEWGIVSSAEENAENIYRSVFAALSCDVNVTFTDEAEKLGMPQGVSGDVLKGGGVLIIHTATK